MADNDYIDLTESIHVDVAAGATALFEVEHQPDVMAGNGWVELLVREGGPIYAKYFPPGGPEPVGATIAPEEPGTSWLGEGTARFYPIQQYGRCRVLVVAEADAKVSYDPIGKVV